MISITVQTPEGDVTYTAEKDLVVGAQLTEQNTLVLTDRHGRAIAGYVAGAWLSFLSEYAPLEPQPEA